MTVWMMVTNDRYELPLIVADTAEELARRVGGTTSGQGIRSVVYHFLKGEYKTSIYRKVEIDDETD